MKKFTQFKMCYMLEESGVSLKWLLNNHSGVKRGQHSKLGIAVCKVPSNHNGRTLNLPNHNIKKGAVLQTAFECFEITL